MNHLLRSSRNSALTRLSAVTLALAAMLALPASDAAAQGRPSSNFNVVPMLVTSVTVQDGQLVANGLVGTTPFQAPITLTPGAMPANGTCPILDLSLGPINLSLLGLNVDTSPICLEITATQGGGLLGDLLCSIANLLSIGTPLSDILASLTSSQLQTLNGGLTQLLNQAVFIPLSSAEALQGATCDVLSLSLGPVDLTLLGLNVRLDDCNDGPVTLDITATPGGGLLGDLLCSLADHPLNNLSQPVLKLLRQIAAVLGGLLS